MVIIMTSFVLETKEAVKYMTFCKLLEILFIWGACIIVSSLVAEVHKVLALYAI